MAIIRKWTLEVFEAWKSSVLIRFNDIGVLERPWKGNIWVIPANPVLMSRRIIIGHFVRHESIFLQGDKPMGETGRNVKLLPAIGRELNRNILSEARRAVSYVHCDVKNSSAQNAD